MNDEAEKKWRGKLACRYGVRELGSCDDWEEGLRGR
jgi:hypothetical protein